MLAELIEITANELNTGNYIERKIKDLALIKQDYKVPYRPVSVRIRNKSGSDVYYHFFTELEYNRWKLDNSISDPVLVESGIDEINSLYNIVSYIVVKGTGNHVDNLQFYVLKESTGNF